MRLYPELRDAIAKGEIHLTGALMIGPHLGGEDADAVHLELRPGGHHAGAHPGLHAAVHHAQVGDDAQVGDKQDKVAHRQAAGAQAAGGQQHDQTRAHAHRVGRDGVQSLRHQPIGQHGPPALLA